eukprot:g13906.t1
MARLLSEGLHMASDSPQPYDPRASTALDSATGVKLPDVVVLDDPPARQPDSTVCCSQEKSEPEDRQQPLGRNLTRGDGSFASAKSQPQNGLTRGSATASIASSVRDPENSWHTVGGLVGRQEVERLVWEMPFEWRSDMLVEFSAVNGMVKFGCEEFLMKGDMQIVMRPILNEIPLFGGMSVGFINPPEMDFKFVGTGSGLAQVPMFARKLKHQASSQFAKTLVLPYSMYFRTVAVDKLDLPSLRFMPVPNYCVRVEILEMKSLPASDFNLFSQATSDPYAVFKLGPLTYQTDTVKANLNPVFSQKLVRSGEFMVYNARQRLYVEGCKKKKNRKLLKKKKVFDRDVVTADDLLAKGDWIISDIFGDNWLDLTMAPDMESPQTPQIRIRVTKFFAVVGQPTGAPPPVLGAASHSNSQKMMKAGLTAGATLLKNSVRRGMSKLGVASSLPAGTDPTAAILEEQIAHLPKECQPRNYLLEIKVYGATGCAASSMSAINMRLNIGKNTFFDTMRSLPRGKLKGGTTRAAGTTSAEDGPVPVSAEVVQQLRFAGYSAARIAHFLEVDIADVENHLRGAHEELWCKSFFVFVREPAKTKVKLTVLGSKSPYQDPTKFVKNTQEEERKKVFSKTRVVVGVIQSVSRAVSAVTRVFKFWEKKEPEKQEGDAFVEEEDEEEEALDNLLAEDKPSDPDDPAYTEMLAKVRQPNVFELQDLLSRANYAERLLMRPAIGGQAGGVEVDISFQLRVLEQAFIEEVDEN